MINCANFFFYKEKENSFFAKKLAEVKRRDYNDDM